MEFDLILGRIEKEGIRERNCLILEVVANCFNFTMIYHAQGWQMGMLGHKWVGYKWVE